MDGQEAPLFEATLALADSVYRFLRRWVGNDIAAEELTQETLVIAWQKHRQLKNASSLKVWLLQIARRVAIDRARKIARDKSIEFESIEDIPTKQPPLLSLLSDQENVKIVMNAMEQLPPRQRLVLFLTAVEGLTPMEIADVLSITPAAVRASLVVARERMRAQFGTSLIEK